MLATSCRLSPRPAAAMITFSPSWRQAAGSCWRTCAGSPRCGPSTSTKAPVAIGWGGDSQRWLR
eukprot:3182296-Pyramimonas_sp.AAC.1